MCVFIYRKHLFSLLDNVHKFTILSILATQASVENCIVGPIADQHIWGCSWVSWKPKTMFLVFFFLVEIHVVSLHQIARHFKATKLLGSGKWKLPNYINFDFIKFYNKIKFYTLTSNKRGWKKCCSYLIYFLSKIAGSIFAGKA